MNYYGDKKDKRVKYKTRENEVYEDWERRTQLEQEAYMRLNFEDEFFDAEEPRSHEASRFQTRTRASRNQI